MNVKSITFFVFVILATTLVSAQQSTKVVQIDINSLLNARLVSTSFNGIIKGWTKGIDGNGEGDGYLTLSAAIYGDNKDPHALPDNPLIPATDNHPDIKLHYNNRDSIGFQARYVSGEGQFAFDVPVKKYRGLYISLTSSERPSQLQIQLVFKNGNETRYFTLPDYYSDIVTSDKDFGYLVHNLAKWNKKNIMAESDHHNIDILYIHPNVNRPLKRVIIKKSKSGFLVFWAATGTLL